MLLRAQHVDTLLKSVLPSDFVMYKESFKVLEAELHHYTVPTKLAVMGSTTPAVTG